MRQIVGASPCPLQYIDVSQTLFELVLLYKYSLTAETLYTFVVALLAKTVLLLKVFIDI